MRTTIVVTEPMLDAIIRTDAQQMYRAEYYAMAVELKALRARFNRREDLHMGPEGDMDRDSAAGWANGLRSKLSSMQPGDVFNLPDIRRMMRYVIRAEAW